MLDRSIFKFAGAARALATALALGLSRAACTAAFACALAEALVALWNGVPADAAAWSLGAFALFFMARQALAAAESRVMDGFSASSADTLMRKLLAAVLDRPPVEGAPGSAALAAQSLEGVRDVQNYIYSMVPRTVDAICIPALLLCVLFWLDWVSGLIALVLYPFIFVYMRLIGASAGRAAESQHAEFERMSDSFADSVDGLEDLAAFGTVQRFADRVFESSERFRKATMDTLKVAMLSTAVLDLFATMALAAVAIMLGFRLVDGTMEFFPALAVLILVPEYFKPVKLLGSDYHASLAGKEALAAAREFLGESSSALDGKRERLLGSLDVSVVPGRTTVVLGPSGSGKTTLLNVLAGFTQAPEGFSLEEGGSHLPPDHLQCDAWRRRIAYIPQFPYIFNQTLRDNAKLYAPQSSDDEVLRALELAGLGQLLEQMPGGLDERLGQSGRQLSGGEAQRLALARALLCPNRDIWILDEPTSHLDSVTEQSLIDTVVPLMEDKTVFLATHRDAWTKAADSVLTLDARMEAAS